MSARIQILCILDAIYHDKPGLDCTGETRLYVCRSKPKSSICLLFFDLAKQYTHLSTQDEDILGYNIFPNQDLTPEYTGQAL